MRKKNKELTKDLAPSACERVTTEALLRNHLQNSSRVMPIAQTTHLISLMSCRAEEPCSNGMKKRSLITRRSSHARSTPEVDDEAVLPATAAMVRVSIAFFYTHHHYHQYKRPLDVQQDCLRALAQAQNRQRTKVLDLNLHVFTLLKVFCSVE